MAGNRTLKGAKPSTPNGFLSALEGSLGKDMVFSDIGTRCSYMGSNYFGAPLALPDYVVIPEDVEDVRTALMTANEYVVPVTPVASGTMEPSTIPYAGGIVLDTYSRMNRIHEINYDDGYAVIEPGTTIGQLTNELLANGWRFPTGSFPPGVSVIGSCTNKSNTTMRTAVVDDVLGLEVVIPDGTVIRTGSAALEGAGWYSQYGPFPGFRELFLCANGSMGVITKAAVRIYPNNEKQSCPVAVFDSYEDAHKYSMKLARGNMVNHLITYHWSWWRLFEAKYNPLTLPDGTGARHVDDVKEALSAHSYSSAEKPDDMSYSYVAAIMTGYREDIEAREKLCVRLAKECNGTAMTAEEFIDKNGPKSGWFYDNYVNGKPFSPQEPRGAPKMMGRGSLSVPFSFIVFVPPSKVVEYEKWIIKRTIELFGSYPGYYSHVYDQGRSVFFRTAPKVPYGDEDAIEDARKKQMQLYDEASREFGAIPKRVFFKEKTDLLLPRMGGYTELWRRIKREVDPNNIMNPGYIIIPGMEG